MGAGRSDSPAILRTRKGLTATGREEAPVPGNWAAPFAIPPLQFRGGGGVADASKNCGGIGAALPNLARLAKLGIAQNVERAPRYETAQDVAWSQPARERGNMDAIRAEPRKFNRDRLRQCAQGKKGAFRVQAQG